MDCQTPKLESIKHDKARLASFRRRKHSLMKKAHELSILCDVEVGIILYGPKLRGQPVELETWYSKESDLTSIIRKYKEKISAGGDHGQQRTLSLSKYDENKTRQVDDATRRARQVDDATRRTRQVDDATRRAREKICLGKFTTWDQRLDSLSEEQLKMIIGKMDNKLKVVDRKHNMTWTLKESDLTSIIRKYKEKISSGGDHGQQRTFSLFKFDEYKTRQVDDAIRRACEKICVGKFITWDQRMDSLSEQQLKMIIGRMGNKLKVVDRKLNMTWPLKESDLTSIIRKYKEKITAGVDRGLQRTLSYSKFEKNKTRQVDDVTRRSRQVDDGTRRARQVDDGTRRANQVDDATRRAREKICVGKFTTWDERMDSLSEEQLQMILGTMDSKLKVVEMKLNMIKGDQNLMNNSTSRKLDGAKSLVNLQPDYQVNQKLPSNSSGMVIQCGGRSGSTIPFTQLEGPTPLNSWPSYEQTLFPMSSGVYDENAAQPIKRRRMEGHQR